MGAMLFVSFENFAFAFPAGLLGARSLAFSLISAFDLPSQAQSSLAFDLQ